MVLIGLSWLVYWLLVDVFTVESLHAALATALIFIIVGILTGERPFINHR
jgi:hypothetical protein